MASWLTSPKPHSETVKVSTRRIPADLYDSVNGRRVGTVSEVDRFLTVAADDTARGITTVGVYARYGTEEWVMAVLTAYDRIQELRERDPGRTGMIFSF